MESSDRFLQDHDTIVIFGYAALGRELYQRVGSKNQIVFVDISHVKQGKQPNGIEVFSLETAKEKFPRAGYVIASLYHGRQMVQQLRSIGIPEEQIETDLPKDIVERENARNLHRHTTPKKLLSFETNIGSITKSVG